MSIPASGAGHIRVDVGAPGGTAKLVLRDSAGHEVATRELGPVGTGLQTLALPADLPAGSYSYELRVTSGDKSAPVTTYITGVVDGVSFKDGSILLKIGSLSVSLDALAEIGPMASAFAGATTSSGITAITTHPATRLPPISGGLFQ